MLIFSDLQMNRTKIGIFALFWSYFLSLLDSRVSVPRMRLVLRSFRSSWLGLNEKFRLFSIAARKTALYLAVTWWNLPPARKTGFFMAITGTKRAEQHFGWAASPALSCRLAYTPTTVLLKLFICQRWCNIIRFWRPSVHIMANICTDGAYFLFVFCDLWSICR